MNKRDAENGTGIMTEISGLSEDIPDRAQLLGQQIYTSFAGAPSTTIPGNGSKLDGLCVLGSKTAVLYSLGRDEVQRRRLGAAARREGA